MKKVFIFSMTLFLAASVSSCKKDYTCTCSDAGTPIGTYPINNSTKSSATSNCNTEATNLNNAAGGGTAITCNLN